ncbi:thiol reductant ABC exporter subunit CydC [Dyella sp. KRB-257]|uniref:thiol reductant ABC exporter subunit CydC n=1 Tax=Dyella sp. KRB-257 TaxID=3400915 RepID=UPI003C05CF29
MKRRDLSAQSRADMRRLWTLFRPYVGWMLAGALLANAALLANVGLLAVSGHFIASMALAGVAGIAFNYFTPAALIRAFALTRTGGRYLERLITHEATFRLLAQLRVWFYERLEPLAPARLQALRATDLLSRIQADIDTLNQLYLRLFVPVAVAALASVAIVAVMAVFSVPVALGTALLLASAGVWLPRWLQRRGAAAGARVVQTRTALRNTVADALGGDAELRVYRAQGRWHARVQQQSETLLDDQRQLSGLSGLATGAVGLCAHLALWWAVIAVAPAVAQGAIAPAQLAMLALFAMAAFEAVMPLPLAFQMLGEQLAAARRIFAVVDAEPAVSSPAGESPTPLDAGVVFDGVRFRYDPSQPWVLDRFDLTLAPGSRTALVGASGAGKSSVLQLLARFWDCQEGRILLGGHPLDDYAPDDARRHIAVVSQDAYLFNGSVLDNLLLARPDADAVSIEAACRAARVHEVIEALPDGYHTSLGEAGTRLSGGQARRLAIARALLKDAPILLLDEPTEGLDAATAGALYDSLAGAMAGRTVLLITHQLGPLAGLVDEVAVLDAGRIVQRGSPAALAATDGPYRALQDLLG